MAKNNTNIWIAVAIVAAALIIAPNLNLNLNNDIPLDPDEEQINSQYTASIYLTPNEICKGEVTTGYVNSNINNGACAIFVDYGTGYEFLTTILLDSNGDASQAATVDVVGIADLKAVCGLDNQFTVSNEVSLIVKDCPDTTCTDSDGGSDIYTPGYVSAFDKKFYDKCVDSDTVSEYICGDTSVVEGNSIDCGSGKVCIDTRSGGYCADFSGYSDGDLISQESGSGTGSGDSWNINLGDDGGNCGILAQISTSWSYANEYCTGIAGDEGVMWTLLGDGGVEFQRTDTSPFSIGYQTQCGLTGKDFTFSVEKTMGLPLCELDYEWDIKFVACNCGEQ